MSRELKTLGLQGFKQRELDRIIQSGGAGICINATNVDKLVEHLRRMSNGEENVCERYK